jgi:hypothetical protein
MFLNAMLDEELIKQVSLSNNPTKLELLLCARIETLLKDKKAIQDEFEILYDIVNK